jgi:phosphatidylglycerol lysyltransferase
MKIGKYLKVINNKRVFQIVLALVPILFCIYFIRNEGVEIKKSFFLIGEVKFNWLLLALFFTLLYIYIHGNMYVASFKTIHSKITFSSALILSLKRSFISVFLPAGGITSLVYFTKPIESQGISKARILLASSVYSISAFGSLVLISIPAIFMLFINNDLDLQVFMAFLVVIVFAVFIFIVFRSIVKGSWAFKFIRRKLPKIAVFIDDLKDNNFSAKYLIRTLFFSFLIELCGIVHLYIAMKAIGVDASLKLALFGYVVATLMYAISPFLRGLGAVELTLVTVLATFGILKISAISISLFYRIFEFWIPLIIGGLSFMYKKDNLVLRIFPSIFTLILGFVNIFSVLTPAIQSRLHLVKDFLPTSAIHLSNFAVIMGGVILIFLSAFLVRGLKNAWWLAILISSISVVGHITKAIDYEEAILNLVLIALLLYTRKNYIIRSDRRLFDNYLTYLIYGLIFIFIYGIVGFYIIDVKHFKIDFSFRESLFYLVNTAFLFNNGILIQHTGFSQYFTHSLNFFGFSFYACFLIILLKPAFFRKKDQEEELLLATDIVDKYGNSPLDYFKLYWDKIFYICKNKDALISFKTYGDYAVVLEMPVCKEQEQLPGLILEFENYCKQYGLRTLYYRVDEKHLPIFEKLKKKHVFVGQEGVIDISQFSLEGGDRKPLRNAMNKIKKDGFTCKIIEPPVKEGIIQKLKAVSNEWLIDFEKKEEIFSGGAFEPKEIKNQLLFVIEDIEEKIVAFANMIPDYAQDEVTYDLIRKTTDAPNGVMDVLIINMIEYYKNQGKKYLNLGLAPFSGIDEATNLTERTLKFAYHNLKRMQHFKGLRFFKEKFANRWDNKYLIYSSDFDLIQAPLVLSKISRYDG